MNERNGREGKVVNLLWYFESLDLCSFHDSPFTVRATCWQSALISLSSRKFYIKDLTNHTMGSNGPCEKIIILATFGTWKTLFKIITRPSHISHRFIDLHKFFARFMNSFFSLFCFYFPLKLVCPILILSKCGRDKFHFFFALSLAQKNHFLEQITK